MTVKELSRLYHLRREFEREKERLEQLRILSQKPPGISLSGTHGASSESRTERYAVAPAELESVLAEKALGIIAERIRLERYIASVPESYIRQIFQLRFVDGRSWNAVARKMGGGNTADACRKAAERYLEACESE